MDLYLLRHAKAEKAGKAFPDDARRPLSDEGRRAMKQAAPAMARLIGRIDLALSSPLDRARETAEILLHACEHDGKLKIEEALSGIGGVETILKILRKLPEDGAVLMTGHAPTFDQLVAALISNDGSARVEMHTGSLARIEMPDPKSLRGTLHWVVPVGAW